LEGVAALLRERLLTSDHEFTFFNLNPFLRMRKLVAAACITVSLSSARSAHSPGDEPRAYPKSVAVRATTLTQALNQHIHFNEGQYVQVKQVHLHYLEERRLLQVGFGLVDASSAERDEQLAAAQYRYERALSDVLNPDQRGAYQLLRASFTAHRLQ
jgi:hypothetical protein